MKYLIIIMAIIAMSTEKCKDRDDTGKVCTEACTFINGYFLEPNGNRIRAVEYELYSNYSNPIFGSRTRKIAAGKTNGVGEYSMKVHLEDDELGEYPRAKLYIKYIVDTSIYVAPILYEFNFGDPVQGIVKRDTSVKANVYLIRKGIIKVNIRGYVPQKNNSFDVIARCKCGLDKKNSSNSTILSSAEGIQTKQLISCGGDTTIFTIIKRKNDIESHYDTTVFTPLDDIKKVEFNY